MKYFDARRKKQMVDMLYTASGEVQMPISNLLKEIESEKPTGLKGILKSFQFSRHAQRQIQQAGMSWSSTRLIAAMGLAMIPGLGLGRAASVFDERTGHRILVLAGVFGAAPYLYVRTGAPSG